MSGEPPLEPGPSRLAPDVPPPGEPPGEPTFATAPDDIPPHPEPVHGPRLWPRVVGVLVLLLGAGGAWLWQNPDALHRLFPGAASHDTELTSLEARVTRLEQRPVPANPDASIAALTARLDALEKRVAQTEQTGGQSASGGSSGEPAGQRAQQANLGLVIARLNALEAHAGTAPDTAAGPSGGADVHLLAARLDALEHDVAEHEVDPAKIDAISAKVDALSERDPASGLRTRLEDVEHQVTALTAKQAGVEDVADRARQLSRVEAAEMALAAGQPLGPIPDAPEALTRYATAAPPTEATLRLAFPAAEQAALMVSQPDTKGKPFLDRIIARLQDFRLITVREGDRVVIGNSTAAMLARARALLDAGDLNGAVRAVAGLTGPPADKMAPWLDDAKALIAAREALTSLAGSN